MKRILDGELPDNILVLKQVMCNSPDSISLRVSANGPQLVRVHLAMCAPTPLLKDLRSFGRLEEPDKRARFGA